MILPEGDSVAFQPTQVNAPPPNEVPLVDKNVFGLDLAGVEIRQIQGVPIVELSENNPELLLLVAEHFGPNTLFRVASETFLDDAVNYGTDKANLSANDHRHIVNGAGWDVHGIEAKAKKFGLTAADVLYASSYDNFISRMADELKSELFGLPTTHAIVLIYNHDHLASIGSEGYVFYDKSTKKVDTSVQRKKEALLGIVKFKPNPLEFEKKLASLDATAEKVLALESEIALGFADQPDLNKALCLGFHITDLAYKESTKINQSNPESTILSDLMAAASSLNQEIDRFKFILEMEEFLSRAQAAFLTKNSAEMELTEGWPSYCTDRIQLFLQESQSNTYSDRLTILLEKAAKLKETYHLS